MICRVVVAQGESEQDGPILNWTVLVCGQNREALAVHRPYKLGGFCELCERYNPCHMPVALKLAGFKFLAQVLDMFAHRGVVLEAALHAVDGMQSRGVIAVEAFSNGLQGLVRVSSR